MRQYKNQRNFLFFVVFIVLMIATISFFVQLSVSEKPFFGEFLIIIMIVAWLFIAGQKII